MRRQTVVALAIAIVLGLFAVYLANIFLTQSAVQQDPEGTTRIAVAAVPLDYGVDITPEKIKFVAMPTDTLPAGSFRTVAELLPQGKRRVAIRPITINEPILVSKLAGEGLGPSIAALLPDGMRAAAVRIDDVSGVAGFIQPNDSVDVLITRGASDGKQITDVLLQNTKVMAIDQSPNNAEGAPQVGRTATLQVNPIDAQKLALAQQLGRLSLVLRKPGEVENNPALETVSLEDLRYGLYGARYTQPAGNAAAPVVRRAAPVRRPAPRPAAPRVVRPDTNSVEVVRGTTNSNYEVGGYGS